MSERTVIRTPDATVTLGTGRIVADDDDPIAPIRIAHRCDDVYDVEGNLSEKYNYLVYDFETEARTYWARAYLDTPEKVTLFGPFTKDVSRKLLVGEAVDPRILAYLNRRFSAVDLFPARRSE